MYVSHFHVKRLLGDTYLKLTRMFKKIMKMIADGIKNLALTPIKTNSKNSYCVNILTFTLYDLMSNRIMTSHLNCIPVQKRAISAL